MLESITTLNYRLERDYGKADDGRPNFRIVWSNDEFEKRLGTYEDRTESGIFIREVTEVREVPKYRQWAADRYILERLIPVPFINADELLNNKLSYEPVWVFEGKDGHPLPPKWEACTLVIETLLFNITYGSHYAKYKDPEISKEAREARITKITEELFGNETDTGDALAYREGIVVPRNYGDA